ncbi:hypothetical protein SY88_17285 [Clostridiales bacterium PH28_bin88]|nr:hypothetical protein SY88_17285 [Clostridiales bacterium PH28_bin88]
MKKIVPVLLTVMIGMLLSSPVFAGDVLYRMMHAGEVESLKADQDAFIVGQLIEKNNDQFLVTVYKVINGKLNSDTILVNGDFQYGLWRTGLTPQVGDYCVMSLKKSGAYYKQAWGIFKADSGDYKTLKLVTEYIKYPSIKGDMAAIEWYVNSGGTDKDFSFEGNTVFVSRPNGERIQIYPKQGTRVKLSTVNITTSQIKPENNTKNSDLKTITLAVAIAIVAGLVLVALKKKR